MMIAMIVSLRLERSSMLAFGFVHSRARVARMPHAFVATSFTAWTIFGFMFLDSMVRRQARCVPRRNVRPPQTDPMSTMRPYIGALKGLRGLRRAQ